MLKNVILLGLFIFIFFGIIGVQLFKGLLRHRCYFKDLNSTHSSPFYTAESDFICSIGSGLQTCLDVPNSNLEYNCLPSPLNPFQNSISFDNIAYGFITIFQVWFKETLQLKKTLLLRLFYKIKIISLSNWITLLFVFQDAHSFYDWVYFVLVIMVNIMLCFKYWLYDNFKKFL